MKITYQQTAKHRLDKFLTQELGLSRTKVQQLIKDGEVKVNQHQPSVHQFLQLNDQIEVGKLAAAKKAPKKTVGPNPAVTFKVIEENKDYLIIEKPAGVIVHPTEKMEQDTLVNGLLAKYPELSKVGESKLRPGIVHRLDKEVSGLMIVPRTQKSFEYFKNLLKTRQVKKVYTALVHGDMDRNEGTIDFKIGRSRRQGKMAAYPAASADNKEAMTHFIVKDRYKYLTLLEVEIMTGRTHQIRVHLNAINHPVVGDRLYTQHGIKRKNILMHRIFLHATLLEFIDPSGEKVIFKAPLPKELKDILKSL